MVCAAVGEVAEIGVEADGREEAEAEAEAEVSFNKGPSSKIFLQKNI